MGIDITTILAALQLIGMIGGGFWYAATQSARLAQIEQKLDAIPEQAQARASRIISAFEARMSAMEAHIKSMQDEIHYLRERK